MRMRNVASNSKRRATVATNVSLDSALVAEARKLGVNISRASTIGLQDAVAKARAERWLDENRLALNSSNAFLAKFGLPLKSLRLF